MYRFFNMRISQAHNVIEKYFGSIEVLNNAVGVEGYQISLKKVLQRCTYGSTLLALRGVGGC